MRAAPLATFVAGAFVLQRQASLPDTLSLVGLGLAALLTGVGMVAAARYKRSRVATALACVATALLGFLWAAHAASVRLADELSSDDEGRNVRIAGVVSSLPALIERGTRFEFDVEQVLTEGVHVPRRVSLAWYGERAVVIPAERWEFTVRLKRPQGSLNPGGFDFEAWMLERNLRASGYVRDGANDAPQRRAAWVWSAALIDRARHKLRARLQARLQGSRYGGVLIALVLGDQRAIREEDWQVFNRTGISHLVSISGLHITMIAGLAAALVNFIWRRSRRLLLRAPAQSAAAVAAMAAALGYCLLAGWGVPAQRTFFMLATVAAALMLRWHARPFLTLSVAAFVVTVLDPWAVIAPGFWLSFGAVAVIFYVVGGRPDEGRGWRPQLRAAVRVQIAVTLALMPMTIVFFQQWSLVSPLANAVAIPLVSLVVTPLALVAAVLVMMPPPLDALATPVLGLAHTLFDFLATGLRWSLSFPWASLPMAAPPSWAMLVALVGVAWLLAPPGWPLRWLALTWLLPLFVWPPARPAAGELWVTALDVGQGMAMLVETDQHALLFDSGARYSAEADAGARVIGPYLRWRGIDRLDLMIISHQDNDHAGGAASLLRQMLVERLWSSVRAGDPLLAGATSAQPCVTGQSLELGALQLRILHPPAEDYGAPRSTNAMSCVLQLRLGPHRVLLAGDLPMKQEIELIAREPDLQSTLLVAPHHGSRSSSSAPFVAATRPDWVVYQVGYRNRFGHPAPEVVTRYDAAGTKSVRTDATGATQWRMQADGSVQIDSMRVQHARYWFNRASATLPESASDDLSSEQAEPQVEARPSF